MAIGSLSDTTGVRAARENTRLNQSLLQREYRRAKRSGDYMGALKASALAEDMGLRVGGTIRSEDVAAAGEQQYQSDMQKIGMKDAPTGLDAYKAMQPQARQAQAPAPQQGSAGATDDLTTQFRDIYQKAETPEEKLAIVRDAKKVGVPLSKFGEEMLTKAGEQAKPAEQVAPKIRPPMTVTGPDGKPQFTDEGRKYYESLGTSEQVANTVAESQGARLGRKLREQYRSMVGAMGTAAKTQKEVSDIERDFEFRGAVPEYEGKMKSIKPLEEEQARIKESQSKVIRSQIAREQGGNPLLVGLPKPATQFAQEKPDWAAAPKLKPVPYTVPKRQQRQPRIPTDQSEYETGLAEYKRKQEEQKKRNAEIDSQIAQASKLRPPTR